LAVRKRSKTAALKFGVQKEKQNSYVEVWRSEREAAAVLKFGGQKEKQNSCVEVWRL
jgi:hypothetical protein